MGLNTFPLQSTTLNFFDTPALIDERFLPDNGIKFNEYAWGVERCAGALTAEDEISGNVVALAVSPTIECVLTFWAILRAGGRVLLVNPKLPEDTVSRALRRTGAQRLLGAEYCGHVAVESLVGLGGALESVTDVLEPHAHDVDAPATIFMTSGSTGEPKYVVHSLANHLASAQAANGNIPLGPGDRWLLSLPLYHVAGIAVVVRCLSAGAAVVFPEPEHDLADTLVRLEVTHVSLVATQLYRLLNDAGGRRALRGLKAVLLGGSAIPTELIREAHAIGVPIHTSYGMTETASQIACTPPGASLDELMTSGLPLSEGAVRISTEGEILAGGPSLFLGYLREDGELDAPDPARGFETGDLGELDARGFLRVTGRRDNQFISGGENIQPEEIERALLAVAGVAEAMVVPVPAAEWGRRPVAFVRTARGEAPDALRLAAALSAALPRYKLPIAYHDWPETTSAGMKVSRVELRRLAEELHSDS